MRVNRLFEMIYVLLSERTVTAKQLAERLEVSVRTVYRDIELLSAAGIPVYMSKGRGGGIRLLDGFVLNKSVLSEREQQETGTTSVQDWRTCCSSTAQTSDYGRRL